MEVAECKAKMLALTTDELARTIKSVAETGNWDGNKVELDAPDDDDTVAVIRAAMDAAMTAMKNERTLPEWFMAALSATKTLMMADEMQGIECVAALYQATERTEGMTRMMALEQIASALSPVRAFGLGGLGSLGLGLGSA